MRCAAVDAITCKFNPDDQLTLDESLKGSIFVEITNDATDQTVCVGLDVETATELRDALSRWIGEQ
jgi:hypothetical protein